MAKTTVEELVSIWRLEGDDSGAKLITNGIDSVKFALKGLTIAAAAGTAAIAGILSRAGQYESLTLSMEVMLKGSEQAKKTIQELTDFANRTPFETKDILEYGKTLAGIGFEAKDLQETIKIMGDTAAGVGMDRMPIFIKTIGEMKSLKRVEWEALKRIALTGAPIIEDMSKSYGVSAEAFKKMVAAGTVKVDDVLASMKRLTTGDGPFSGMMEKQSTSLFGLWSTILGTLDDMIKRTGQTLLPVWKKLMKTYIAWFKVAQKGIEEKLVKFYKDLSDAVLFAFDTLKSTWSAIDTMVQMVGGWGTVIKATVGVLTVVLVAGIGMVAMGLWSLVPSLFAVNAAGAPLFLALSLAAIKMFLIGAAIVFVGLLIQDFIVWMQGGESQFGSFYESIGRGLDKIKTWVSDAYNWVKDKIMQFLKFLQSSGILKFAKFLGPGGMIASAVSNKILDSQSPPSDGEIKDMASSGKTSETVNQNNNVEVSLNVEGLSPEASEDKIAEKTGDAVTRSLREAERDSLAEAI